MKITVEVRGELLEMLEAICAHANLSPLHRGEAWTPESAATAMLQGAIVVRFNHVKQATAIKEPNP